MPRPESCGTRTTEHVVAQCGEYYSEFCNNRTTDTGPGGLAMDISGLQETLRRFAAERNWEQFHSPKNLAIALSIEASELLEHFQWLTEEQSRTLTVGSLAEVAEEIADVQIYLARLTDVLGVDIDDAVQKKLSRNAQKHPPNTDEPFTRCKGTPER